MSEYQRVAFRAIDAPVSEENLEYMHTQSSRAEITPWSFDNEYHYGDFHGKAEQMLRRGYDFYFHYANFGIRRLMFRLPNGLPNPAAVKLYLDRESLYFSRDKKGPGGILCIEPYYEPGDLEELGDVDEFPERLVPLRAEILDGDLRPFYLARLALGSDCNHDPERTTEGPVPAGLDQLTSAGQALAELYGLGPSLIAAAAQNCPALQVQADRTKQIAAWLKNQPAATKDAWLAQWMANPHATARSELLAEFKKATKVSFWPTLSPRGTIAKLHTAANAIQGELDRRAAEKAKRQRTKKLAAMAADPAETLRKIERLVAECKTTAYSEVAKLLAELREALASSSQSGLAQQQAIKLKNKYPTRRTLLSKLRDKGFKLK